MRRSIALGATRPNIRSAMKLAPLFGNTKTAALLAAQL
jgi:hypothetical protein